MFLLSNDRSDCVQFVGDLILSKSVENKVVLWRPIIESEGDEPVYSKQPPSGMEYLWKFELEHCNHWFVRFHTAPPKYDILALGNSKGKVYLWHLRGANMSRKPFRTLDTETESSVRMVLFNPHGGQLVAVKDDSTVWLWDS